MIRINRQRRNSKQSGQGMTEYIIIVGLIAIFLITAVKEFGTELNKTYEKSKTKIADHVTTAIDSAGTTPSSGN